MEGHIISGMPLVINVGTSSNLNHHKRSFVLENFMDCKVFVSVPGIDGWTLKCYALRVSFLECILVLI